MGKLLCPIPHYKKKYNFSWPEKKSSNFPRTKILKFLENLTHGTASCRALSISHTGVATRDRIDARFRLPPHGRAFRLWLCRLQIKNDQSSAVSVLILIPLVRRLALESQPHLHSSHPTLPQRYTTIRVKDYKNPENFQNRRENSFWNPTLPQRYTTIRVKDYKNPENFQNRRENSFWNGIQSIDWLIGYT